MKRLKPRILFFLRIPPPVTGPTLMNQRILDSQSIRARFEIEAIVFNFAQDIRDIGKFTPSKLIKSIMLAAALIGRAIVQGPDLYYFQISPVGGAFVRDAAYAAIMKAFRKKIIFHIRGKGIRELASQKGLYSRLYKFVFHQEELICFSRRLALDVKTVFSGDPYIIPNGIDIIHLEETSLVRLRPAKRPKILFLSNYLEEKGIFVFLEALARLNKDGFEFETRMVGDEYKLSRAELEKKVYGLGLEGSVSVVGPKYGQDKYDEFLAADIFVFPTLREAFGNVVIEAMQFALPVVASDEGSLSEMIEDGRTGYLFPKGDIAALAERVARLIHEPELRNRLGKAGRARFLTHFTFQKEEERLIRMFEEVLDKSESPLKSQCRRGARWSN